MFKPDDRLSVRLLLAALGVVFCGVGCNSTRHINGSGGGAVGGGAASGDTSTVAGTGGATTAASGTTSASVTSGATTGATTTVATTAATTAAATTGGGGLMCASNGPYCGGDMIGGDPNTLYQCPGAGQAPSSSQACPMGCQVEAAGTPDYCKVNLVCQGNGAYCGGDMIGGDPNTLYQCAGAGQAPSSSQPCAMGCQVQPAGTPDYCKGTCSAAGQGALNWEAQQIAAGNYYSDMCLGFVNTAYNQGGLGGCPAYCRPTAADAMQAAMSSGGWHPWGGSCPCGAVLYWGGNSSNGGDGHVVICNGDGTASTSGWPGFGGNSHAKISWLVSMESNQQPAGWILP